MQCVDFGLINDDYNYKLLQYINADVLSRLYLTDEQIDAYAHILNWDIMSSKYLSGYIFVKYQDRITWPMFLQNGHPKEVVFLLDVIHHIRDHAYIFLNHRIKQLYYNTAFIVTLPEFVDWNWYAKHINVPEYVLLRNWDKFNINVISRYQTMSENVIRQKAYCINWTLASKHLQSEKLIEELNYLVDYSVLLKWQRLSSVFLDKHIAEVSTRKYNEVLCRYQKLEEWFIIKHIDILDMSIISQYQNLSLAFIKLYEPYIMFDNLYKNKYYNNIGTLQIARSDAGHIFIIDACIVNDINTNTNMNTSINTYNNTNICEQVGSVTYCSISY